MSAATQATAATPGAIPTAAPTTATATPGTPTRPLSFREFSKPTPAHAPPTVPDSDSAQCQIQPYLQSNAGPLTRWLLTATDGTLYELQKA